ncbi:MAG: hypothetical protein ACE37K_16535 [Planctomycetota bacterium]
MAHDDPDLEKLTAMLQQCLGRIDEEAYRLQDAAADTFDFGEVDRLDEVTADLQQLIDSLLVVDMGDDEADVNQVVERVADACLQRIEVPIVQRLELCPEAARVAVPTALVTVAVQRAMDLATDPLGPGDEIHLITRVEHDAVVFEVESHGSHPIEAADERAETLRDFVAGFGGGCTVRSEREDLFLVLELPQVMATDRSDRA